MMAEAMRDAPGEADINRSGQVRGPAASAREAYPLTIGYPAGVHFIQIPPPSLTER
jgi:hypothetical protein